MKRHLLLPFVILLFVATTANTQAQTYWSFHCNYSWGTDYNTETEFFINSENDLAQFAFMVRDNKSFKGKTVKLNANLDLSAHIWIPIGGVNANSFHGSFDGQNHTISGLTVEDVSSYCEGLGLFSSIYAEDDLITIKNLTLKGDSISGMHRMYAGSLVGLASANIGNPQARLIIENCHNENIAVMRGSNAGGIVGGVSGNTSIIDCTNKGDVVAGDYDHNMAGGIVAVGGDSVILLRCSNSGTITSGSPLYCFAGGIVAEGTHSITDCVNTGDVTGKACVLGGIIAESKNTMITGCTNSGALKGEEAIRESHATIGGIAGRAFYDNSDALSIVNCINDGSITGENSEFCLGGIVGNGAQVSVSGCTNNGELRGGYSVGGIIGDAAGYYSYVFISKCVNNGSIVDQSGFVGGILGIGYAIITNCINNNSIIGGFCAGGIVGYGFRFIRVINCYSQTDITSYGKYIGGLIGKIETYADSPISSKIVSSYVAGSVKGPLGYAGGLVGTLSTQKNASKPVIDSCVVMLSSLDGNTARRVVGGLEGVATADSAAFFGTSGSVGNYAYVASGNWKDSPVPNRRNMNGADWNGEMLSEPISTWDIPAVWTIDGTHKFMPKLVGLGTQVDIPNLAYKGPTPIPPIPPVTPIPPTPPTPPQPVLHKVNLSFQLDNPELTNCLTLYPGAGEYAIENGGFLTIMAFLADACDQSDIRLLVNGEMIIAEEKKDELRAIAYTFRIPVHGETDIKVIGVERNNPISTDNLKGLKDFKVWVTPGYIHVEQPLSASERKMRIYTVGGQLVYQQNTTVGTTSVSLAKGTYIVVLDDQVVKIIL